MRLGAFGRKFLFGALTISLVGVAAACGQGASPSAPSQAAGTSTKPASSQATAAPNTAGSPQAATGAKTVRIAYGQARGSLLDKVGVRMAEIINEQSKGALNAQTFSDSQLGKDRDQLENLQLGSVEINIQGDVLSTIVAPEWALVLTTPFVIRDKDHFRKVIDGPVAQPMYDAMIARKGIRNLGWVDRGPRHLTSNKPINDPSQVKGMKIRVPEVETYTAAWKMMGAIVTPMDFSEVFLALRQGTIDAQENPLEIMANQSLYDVQKYVNLTSHLYTGFEVVASDKWFKALSPEQQKIVTDAAKTAIAEGNKTTEDDEVVYEKKLKEKGMTFNPVDKAKWEGALKDLPKQFEKKWQPGFYEAVKAVK